MKTLLSSVLIVILMASHARAVNFVWTSLSSGSFHIASNWSPPLIGPPDSSNDTATFALAGDRSASFFSDVTNGQLIIATDSGITGLDLNGNTYTLSGPATNSLIVGDVADDNADLRLTDGRVETDDHVFVGNSTNSNGFLTVGAGAVLNSAGVASTLFVIGNNGTGRMDVTGGGDVILQNQLQIGRFAGRDGIVNVNGAGSLLQTGADLFVGSAGHGTLQVSQGGRIETVAGSLSVGNTSSSVGTLNVIGAGSQLDVFGNLAVGNAGLGGMLVSFGGNADAQRIELGRAAGGNGSIVVDGVNSVLRSSTSITLGFAPSSQSTINVKNGGRLEAGTNVTIAGDTTSTGILTVSDTGSIVAHTGAGALTIGTTTGGIGRLFVQNGGHYQTSTGLTRVNANGQILMPVGTSSRLFVNGNLLVDGGLIRRTQGDIIQAANTQVDVINGGRIDYVGLFPFFQGTAINIVGSGSTIENASMFLDDGSHLNVTGGGTLAARLALIDGTASITGVNSLLEDVDRVGGRTGTAALTATQQGIVDSRQLNIPFARVVGDVPHGSVLIETQGQLRAGALNVGANLFEGGSGLINVTGAGSFVLLNDALAIGGAATATVGSPTFGTGIVNVTNGGLFQTGTGAVTVKRTGEINIAGGTFAIHGPMLLDGGRFTLTSGAITQEANTVWTVQNGGHVDFAGNYTLPSQGIVNVDGETSRFEAANTILMANNSSHIQLDAGTLAATTVQLNFGTLSGNGKVEGHVLNNSIIAPGSGAGRLIFTDNLDHQNAGSFQIEVGGTNTGLFDSVQVQGQFNIAGSLDVSMLGGFIPSHLDDFLIFDVVGNRSGTFVGLPEGSPIAQFGFNRLRITYTAGDGNDIALRTRSIADIDQNGQLDCSDVDSLVAELASGGSNLMFDMNGDGVLTDDDLSRWLQAAGAVNLPSGNPYLPGDANLDGFVDGSDFITWNAHKFSNVAAWCSGDFNADGFVDGSDFIIWNSRKFTSSAAARPVPEPSAIFLILFGCFLRLLIPRHVA